MSIIKVKKIVYLNSTFRGILSRPLASGLRGLLFLLLFANVSFAKNPKVDSLLRVIKIGKEDTNKIAALNDLSQYAGWQVGKYDTAKYYANSALNLAKKIDYKIGIAYAYNNLGIIYYYQAQYSKALNNYFATLKIKKELKDKLGIAAALGNIGLAYQYLGNYDKALKYYLAELKIEKEIRNQPGVATALDNIGNIYDYQGNYDKALENHLAALAIQKKIRNKNGIAVSYISIGFTYDEQGKYIAALANYSAALKIKKELGDKGGIATCYCNIGTVYDEQGNYPKALENHLAALKIDQEIGNKNEVANDYTNIGTLYKEQGNHPKALENFLSALKIDQETGNKSQIAMDYSNIGNVYKKQNKNIEALNNYLAALKIDQEIGNKKEIAIDYNGIGEIYAKQRKYKKSLENHLKALKIDKAIENKRGITNSYINIGNVSLKSNKPDKAKKWYKKALALSKSLNSNSLIRDSYKGLALSENILHNYKSAYNNYVLYVLYRDSLKNKQKTKKIVRLQMQYKFNQKQAADSIVHAKAIEIQQAKIYRQNDLIEAKQNEQYALYGGLILLLIFAGFMYNRFRITIKQKRIIEIQKQTVEAKNKEISDSITYAKRIQEAILPSRYSLTENLKNGFVLFKPKDIVSGDFYWLERPSSAGGAIYFAAADCTGHGVPGAMVSVVCANALSKALLEENITETGKLLDRVREIVIQQFSHSDENVKDGMDISLCKLTLPPSGGDGGGLLQWSGANNPLWIIRQNVIASPINREKQSQPSKEASTSKYELIEVKAHKQAIGKTDAPKPFASHNIELHKDDSIYIFSDGYADQFGGKDGKKFKYKPLKELLLSLQEKTMDVQKNILNKSFEEWKGNEEQVDDVCMLGVRI